MDVVYTWVDFNDAKWRASFRRWAPAQEALIGSSSEVRYLDRNELRYSLRSLHAHAPFVGHIYLVTDGQQPTWLRRDHPGLSVIDHRDIFPTTDDLPTFNSRAIEACLHRIPGLSRRFVYFNDDVFLGRKVRPSDLFTPDGRPISRFAPNDWVADPLPTAASVPTDWSAYNANQVLDRDFDRTFNRKMAHAPYALDRRMLYEIETRYPELIERTRRSRFRAPTDVSLPSMFAHYYGVTTEQSVAIPLGWRDYVYANLGKRGLGVRLTQIELVRPKFFCLNSTHFTEVSPRQQARLMRRFLSRMFPDPSPFEVPGQAP